MNPTPAPADSPPDPAVLDRVRGVLPTVRGLIGKVRAVGVVSAGAAVVLWAILFGASAWPLSFQTVLALFVLGVLLLPAAGTFLAVATLREVLALPDKIRALPGAVRESALEAKGHAGGAQGRSRSRRLWGVFGVLWRLRGIVMDTQGSWLQTLALVRFARLASLPFALGLVVLFALNFVVLAAAVLAGLLVLLV
jgi:hypothetical protein